MAPRLGRELEAGVDAELLVDVAEVAADGDGHSGTDQGYRTLLAHHPASGTTLAFFANWRDIPTPTLWAPLTDLFEQLGLT